MSCKVKLAAGAQTPKTRHNVCVTLSLWHSKVRKFLSCMVNCAFLGPNEIPYYGQIQIYNLNQSKMWYFKLFLPLKCVCYMALTNIKRSHMFHRLKKFQNVENWTIVTPWVLQCLSAIFWDTQYLHFIIL